MNLTWRGNPYIAWYLLKCEGLTWVYVVSWHHWLLNSCKLQLWGLEIDTCKTAVFSWHDMTWNVTKLLTMVTIYMTMFLPTDKGDHYHSNDFVSVCNLDGAHKRGQWRNPNWGWTSQYCYWKGALLLKLYNTNTQGGLSKQKEWKTCLAFQDSTNITDAVDRLLIYTCTSFVLLLTLPSPCETGSNRHHT